MCSLIGTSRQICVITGRTIIAYHPNTLLSGVNLKTRVSSRSLAIGIYINFLENPRMLLQHNTKVARIVSVDNFEFVVVSIVVCNFPYLV